MKWLLPFGIVCVAGGVIICPAKEFWLAILLVGICACEIHYARKRGG